MGILDQTDNIVDDWLLPAIPGIKNIGTAPHYCHKSTLLGLAKDDTSGLDGALLCDQLMQAIEHNLHTLRTPSAKPSAENWTKRRNAYIDPANTSPEVTLERAIAAHGPAGWLNQIPTCASILYTNSDALRMIDLAREDSDGGLTIIELKVESNTPLSAAVQVLRYALLLMLSRTHATLLGYSKERNPLVFDFDRVHLKVLAPIGYFLPYDVSWVEQCLDRAVKQLGQTFSFDFEFLSFPLDFNWHDIEGRSAQSVRSALSGIRPLREVLPSVQDRVANIEHAVDVFTRFDPKTGRRLANRPSINSVVYDLNRILKGRRELLFDVTHCNEVQRHVAKIQSKLGSGEVELNAACRSVLSAIGRDKIRTIFEGAFIRFAVDQAEARSELRLIAEQVDNSLLLKLAQEDWPVDDNGSVQSEFVCRLFRFAGWNELIRKWFDEMVTSETHDVSFSAFEQYVGLEKAKDWPKTAESDQALKALLPTKHAS